jgi:uncharacterized protein YndB with AHSA1/START domain
MAAPDIVPAAHQSHSSHMTSNNTDWHATRDPRPMRGSASIRISASPPDVWNLVSDVTQIGRFSPETIAAEWLDGATGPHPGVKFRGRVKRNEKGPIYWTSCTVTECEPWRVFAFTVRSRPIGLPIAPKNTVCLTWRYTFEPAGSGGTLVTEEFELDDIPAMRLYWRAMGWLRGPRMVKDMGRTLLALKSTAEQPDAPARPAD